jgi:multidrug efflux pump subunit AcrA (membrane-fusion protein)
MFSRMNIVAGTRKALVIPKSAVVSCGSNNVVYLKRPDGRYEERTVETGLTCHENVEVLTGLLPGDAVVSKGAFTLRACSLSNTE